MSIRKIQVFVALSDRKYCGKTISRLIFFIAMARDKWIDEKLKTAELQNILSFRINNIKLLYVSAESSYSSLWMGISLF